MKVVRARVWASGQVRGIRAGFLEEVVPNSHLEEGLNDSQAKKDKVGRWGRGNRPETKKGTAALSEHFERGHGIWIQFNR